MEQLTFSLWFTLFMWSLFTLIALIKIIRVSYWEVNANILIFTVALPAIAALLEYLIIR